MAGGLLVGLVAFSFRSVARRICRDRRIELGKIEAWRMAGPGMMLLMAAMLAVVGSFMWMTVRTIRKKREGP